VERSRPHDKRDDHEGSRQSRSVSKIQHNHSPGHSTKSTYACSRSTNNPSMSLVRHQRRRHRLDSLQGELKKIKPPSFDGENKKGEDVRVCLLRMRTYFQLHDYSLNVEAKITVYHLKGKALMWWDQLKQVKHLDEKIISWKQFKKKFINCTC